MTLTFLALVRCIIVFNASNARKWFTRRNIFIIIIILIWTHSLLWSLMPLCGWGKYGPEPSGISCMLAWAELREASGLSYLFSIFAVMLVIPAVIIFSCYTCITVRLHCQYKRMESHRRMSRRGTRVVRRMILITVLMSAGFLVAWTPYAAVSFWSIFYPTSPVPPVVSLLPALFAKTATAYNPVIILYLNSHSSSHFRSDAKKLVTNIRLGKLNVVNLSSKENTGTSTLQPSGAP
ncbi:visual pigment-like receptor peropsin [Clupea harengus]|uniref:Visual pigment-like receptor peropsin n=1 Tax=Clupea harengus TaxID=7950 RepID=A0A6P8GSS7_CLUHA|nr:visual pigment-like receptor peropsin [Clupea harengus]